MSALTVIISNTLPFAENSPKLFSHPSRNVTAEELIKELMGKVVNWRSPVKGKERQLAYQKNGVIRGFIPSNTNTFKAYPFLHYVPKSQLRTMRGQHRNNMGESRHNRFLIESPIVAQQTDGSLCRIDSKWFTPTIWTEFEVVGDGLMLADLLTNVQSLFNNIDTTKQYNLNQFLLSNQQ